MPEHDEKRPDAFDSPGTHPSEPGTNYGRSLSLTQSARVWQSTDAMGMKGTLEDGGSGSSPAAQGWGKPPARPGDPPPLVRKRSSGGLPSTRAPQPSFDGHAALKVS